MGIKNVGERRGCSRIRKEKQQKRGCKTAIADMTNYASFILSSCILLTSLFLLFLRKKCVVNYSLVLLCSGIFLCAFVHTQMGCTLSSEESAEFRLNEILTLKDSFISKSYVLCLVGTELMSAKKTSACSLSISKCSLMALVFYVCLSVWCQVTSM